MNAGNEKTAMPDVDAFKLSTSINNLSLTSDISTCANCGKEGNNPNVCNKCKSSTYCNASCKKKHRHKHKDACERRVAEIHEEQLERERRAAELHDEKLFKQPPPNKDCPICMLLLPSLYTGSKYNTCCGKVICSGCIHAVEKRDGGVGLCPFCRTPTPNTDEEMMEQTKKRVEVDDAVAIYEMGGCYSEGMNGLPQDHAKGLELYHRAAKLGSAAAYYNIGCAYDIGNGVEKKAEYYYELAAMGGCVEARHNLGNAEGRAGNFSRAFKHFMIAAGFGFTPSLENIKQMFMNGDATKDDYAKALRVYQENLIEIKSAQRDEAAAVRDEYTYF